MLVQQLINGISLGSIYALTAIGYSMVYGILELVNFSHGTILMVGAFLYYIFNIILGINGFLAFILSLLVTGMLGVIVEKLTLKPLRVHKLPKFTALICTIGISIFIQNAMMLIMGPQSRGYPMLFDNQMFTLGGVKISVMQLFITSTSIGLMVLLTLIIKKTKIGMAMRATAQNADAASTMGIPVNNIVSLVFFIGSTLAAVAGIFSCINFRKIDVYVGVTIGVKTFAATVLGGIGDLGGAVLGGLVIGIVETFTATYFGSGIRDMVAFIVLIIILVFKPTGLLGKAIQKKV